MDTGQPRYAFTGMEDLPSRDDDDDIVTVGEPIWDVVHVEAIGPATLAVRFQDGVEGRVRFEASALRGTYAKLDDPAYFARVGIAWGAVSWPNEDPDMAPDVMHNELVAGNGEWIVR